MRFLILTFWLSISFAASSQELTQEEANQLLAKGIKQKNVDLVLEALKSNANLKATDSEFPLSLYLVSRLPEYRYPQVVDLIDAYMMFGAAGLQQFEINREIMRQNEAAQTLINNNNNNAGSDAGSGEEIDFGYQANNTHEHSTIMFSEDDEVDFDALLTLSVSHSSASGNKY